MVEKEIGVLACSGEECLGGTLSRLGTRRVMESLRPDQIVTLCLPLYIAGGKEERAFAKNYPVITVDGCDKYCAKKATEKFSGAVKESIELSSLLGEEIALAPIVSGRDMKSEHYTYVDKVAETICEKLDSIAAE